MGRTKSKNTELNKEIKTLDNYNASDFTSKYNVDPETNDFDLEPKKKPKLSTIKKQLRTSRSLEDRIKIARGIPVTLSFDRLKIYVDLDEYAHYIDFKIIDMIESDKPREAIKDYYVKGKKQEQEFTDTDIDFEDFNVEITEIIKNKIREKKQKKSYYNSFAEPRVLGVGFNCAYIENGTLVIDITGKIAACEGCLGLIDIYNIRETLINVVNHGFFTFDVDKFLEVAGCYLCDVTLDIECESAKESEKMLIAMSSFLPRISKDCNIRKYGKNGLFVKKKAQKVGHAWSIYCKGVQIVHSKKIQNRATAYTDMIGKTGEEKANKILRIEFHLFRKADMREYLNIPMLQDGFIPLKSVLEANNPILLNKIISTELGINFTKLEEEMSWYEPVAEIYNQEDKRITEKSFMEILAVERISQLIVDNDYKTDVVKSHIVTEYHADPDSRFVKDLIPLIQKNLYKFLCHRMPKTVTRILKLWGMILDEYEKGI